MLRIAATATICFKWSEGLETLWPGMQINITTKEQRAHLFAEHAQIGVLLQSGMILAVEYYYENISFTFENASFRVSRFWWRARRKCAGLAGYFKLFQQRHSPKDGRYKWGILERERYNTPQISF